MKKFVLITVLSLFCFFCIAQNHGFSVSYAPWGYERLRDREWGELWKGYHSFLKPVLKLDFETHWGGTIHLIEAVYSTVDAKAIDDSTNIPYRIDNIKQVGLFWHPGFVIMPQRRVQIPVYGGLGFNSYFGDIPLYLMFDLSLMVQIRVYLINQLALFGGYSFHYGFGKNSSGVKHYPEIGLIYEF